MRYITEWLQDSYRDGAKFPTQYGMITNRQWLRHEAKRIGGCVIDEWKKSNGMYIALRKK